MRKSDESDAGRRKSLRKKRDSEMSDEFRLDDLDSQTMLETLHPYDPLDQHHTGFHWTPAKVAQQFDFGSQRPPPRQAPRSKPVNSPPKPSNQVRVDNFFSPTKPGAIDSRSRQSNNDVLTNKRSIASRDAAPMGKPTISAPALGVPPPKDLRNVVHTSPKQSLTTKSNGLRGSRIRSDQQIWKVNQAGSPERGRKPAPVLETPPVQPFVFGNRSFNTSVDSRTTSFTSVFSSSGKTSAQTSFTETSDSSQVAIRSLDDPFIDRSPAKALRTDASNARAPPPAAISFGSEHYHVRNFPSKGLFGKKHET